LYTLTVTHLYPNNLNLYGDTGNIIALKKRAEWHKIELIINNLNIGDIHKSDKTDIYFMGGGQDSDQLKVVEDFHQLKAEAVEIDTEDNVVFLGVCGGYQLMGRSFIMGDGEITKGLGIIDIETKAPDKEVKHRCIGNLISEIEELTYQQMRKVYHNQFEEIPRTLVGFENHSGQTFLIGENVRPLSHTVYGFGNNASRTTEGARYKNVFGSYMHGSLLPKNPHLTDFLLWLALNRKYKKEIRLDSLDSKVEYEAHNSIVNRFLKHK
jgi:lipid II isoglutaminyl synthase (glutamine-hydrolysing)